MEKIILELTENLYLFNCDLDLKRPIANRRLQGLIRAN